MTFQPPRRNGLLAALALWAGLGAAQGACPSWPTAERFEFLAGGAEVRDTRTGLVWARCSVGQVWSGNACTGSAGAFTHEAALAHARAQTGWRLPNRRELFSLADKGCLNPAIDASAFPQTSFDYYWSSSPWADNPGDAWGVYFGDGLVYYNYRYFSFAVRLVRASQ